MSPYAQGTSVPVDRTKAELEKLLASKGATRFMYMWDVGGEQIIGFEMLGRQIKMSVPVPQPDDPLFTRTQAGRPRSVLQAQERYEAEVRRRWRSLFAVIKAKLIAVDDQVSTLEREFLSDMMTDTGETVMERMLPVLQAGPGPLAVER